MRLRAPEVGSERGETLVELVIAIAILGIAGVAILTSIGFSVQASAINRNQAGGGAYLKSAAEAIQKDVDGSGTYPGCAGAAARYTADASSVISPTDLSKGYVLAILGAVQSWKGSAGWGSCDTSGVQRVRLQLTTPGDATHGSVETMYVVVRQPCDAAGATPC